jgi:hypothetical protein
MAARRRSAPRRKPPLHPPLLKAGHKPGFFYVLIGSALGAALLAIGLALARSLLEAHGGALRLEAVPGIGAHAC